jgi:iron complex transport system ATP-binding protein
MNAPAPLLETLGLTVHIGGQPVCRGLDLAVQPGQCLAILGRNGAGKSTLLATLAGLRPPTAGSIRLGGDDILGLAPRQAALRRGWLAQAQLDAFASSVLETALTGRHPHLGRWDWESTADAELARQALAAVGLAGLEAREVHTLSGGERQRLAIATLLTQAPPLYLLDEPLTHLDLNHQIAVLDLFTRRARDEGVACVMVLHEPGLAARYCDRALLLYGDGAVDLGSSAAMLSAERLSRLYGHPLQRLEVDGRVAFIPV